MRRSTRKEPNVRDWLDAIRDQIEAHPLRAVAILTSLFSVLGIGLIQEIANRIIDTEVVPWFLALDRIPHWIPFVLVALVVGLLIWGWQQSISITRLKVHVNDEAPATVHTRMKVAEGQRVLLGGYLDTSVLVLETLVASLGSVSWATGDPDRMAHRLIKIILKRIQRMYPEHVIPYVSLYQPSHSDPDYLTIFDSVNVSDERVARARWYIGSDVARQRREGGTAGRVYLKRKTIIRHIDSHTHQAEEGKDYIPSRNPGDVALYVAFVAKPIVYQGTCLGVLCLDSLVKDIFDGDLDQAELDPAVKLLAQALKMADHAVRVT